ncbi:MAG: T9SS type A sorting domain-containing protein [candidate division WOR-3 bacterium]|nr:MAG: T9SS type A sorting domain-containing protein [candidate division WOR-3 bacterium]
MVCTFMLFLFAYSTVTKTFTIDAGDLTMTPAGAYTRVHLNGYAISCEEGAPEMPVMPYIFALPYGARVRNVFATPLAAVQLEGNPVLTFVRKPVILSQSAIVHDEQPNQLIYGSTEPYPRSIVEVKGIGTYDNHTICEISLCPLQYVPKFKKLTLFTSVRVTIEYEGGIKKPARSAELAEIVANPHDITTTNLIYRNDMFEYLIVTEEPMDTVFLRLAEWKTKKGVRTALRTVDWITANYSGEDDAASIRNYLKTLPDSGVGYVLLAGDADIIPCRFAYAMTCSAGLYPGREDTLPTDLYFADLQGTWNYDNDNCYGEIEDSVDLYPDISIGRAPVNTITEAQKFVEKILEYEQNPEADYLDNTLLTADVLWNNPYTDQSIHKNTIEQDCFPPWFDVTKLYDSQGNLHRSTVLNALRQGQTLFNHDGHGWIDYMSAGSGFLSNIDFDTLTNAPRHGVCISIGCWTAAFDFDAIGESFVNSPQGGGVAFIGNTSYGWGSPGNPGYGYSDIFDSRFFYELLVHDHHHLGPALDHCKIFYIPFSREENVYRWHQYQLNLLGDPEMSVWTNVPQPLTVSYPPCIPIGNSSILVSVADSEAGLPVPHALVCLMKGTESYASGYTDMNGTIFLDAAPATTGGCDLTVTAHNYEPFMATVPTVTGPYVDFLGWDLNDSLGNHDGIANPQEEILLDIYLKNTGNEISDNITLTLRSGDPQVTITDSTESITSLGAGDSVCIHDAFKLSIGSVTNGTHISFDLDITDDAHTLVYSPVFLVGTPVLDIDELIVAELPTMPCDTESVYVHVENHGCGYAHTPLLTLDCTSPYIALIQDSVEGSTIPPETTGIIGPLIVAIDAACPIGITIPFDITLTSEAYVFSNQLHLLTGETGFFDDMESGSTLWTTGGTNNLWHLSERQSYSPTHSWYCGNEGSGFYVNNMNCYIQTIPFMVHENSLLRFYRWFHVPLYGTDGIYVIIMGDGIADTLDFIGTGGALDGRGIHSDWFAQSYSLAEYPAGESLRVRIAFISDGDDDVGEGFYIDDVRIEYVTWLHEYDSGLIATQTLHMVPNPFHEVVYISCQPSSESSMTLTIYDAAGRCVKQYDKIVADQNRPFSVTWDGRDDRHRPVSAGVYFVKLETEDGTLTSKIVKLR